MDSGLSLGKLFGIRLRLHYSWFVIFLLVTIFLALDVFPHGLPLRSAAQYWLMGALTSLLFFVSVLIHELAHSIIGQANGIPVGTITLFFFGGGAAFSKDPERPAAELRMAIAGPLSSLALAGFFYFIYRSSFGARELAIITLWLAQINLIVAAFNLLPGLPLDGGRVLRAAVWHRTGSLERATRVAAIAGRVLGYLFIAAGVLIIPVYGDWLGGIWLGLLGWFVADTAANSERQFRLQQLLKGASVAQVMTDCLRVDSETTVSQLKKTYPPDRCFLVTREGKAISYLMANKLKTEKPEAGIAGIAVPLDALPRTTTDRDALSVARQLYESGRDEVAVYDGDNLIGLVTLDSLIAFANNNQSDKAKT